MRGSAESNQTPTKTPLPKLRAACVDLCNDILEEEAKDPTGDCAETTAVGANLVTPRVVTRYADEEVKVSSAAAVDTVYWVCEGCG